MKKLLIMLLAISFTNAIAQKNYVSMTPMLERADDKILAIEQKDRYVVKTIFDIMFKDVNDSRNSLTYVFSKGENYTITALSDPDMVYGFKLQIFQNKNDKWSLVRNDNGNSEMTVKFTPNESALYKLELIATYKGNKNYSHFGLIIDKEQ